MKYISVIASCLAAFSLGMALGKYTKPDVELVELSPKIHTPRNTPPLTYQSYNGPPDAMECHIINSWTQCRQGTHKP